MAPPTLGQRIRWALGYKQRLPDDFDESSDCPHWAKTIPVATTNSEAMENATIALLRSAAKAMLNNGSAELRAIDEGRIIPRLAARRDRG